MATNKRNLMNADELLKLDNMKEVVIERGEKPFICNKYAYYRHPEYGLLENITIEKQKEIFKENLYIKKKSEIKEVKYSFKDF